VCGAITVAARRIGVGPGPESKSGIPLREGMPAKRAGWDLGRISLRGLGARGRALVLGLRGRWGFLAGAAACRGAAFRVGAGRPP